jgi:UDPglucose 6-dehydrogenase
MNITVVGTGYVGLVTGACLAEIGHQIVCVDNNHQKITALQAGQIPIYEPGLEAMVHRWSNNTDPSLGSITFTTDLRQGVAFGDVIFIAVGTPALPNGEPNLQYVEAVARSIGQYLAQGQITASGADANRYRVIVNKSTVPIGSGDWVRMVILEGAAQVSREQALVGVGTGGRSDTYRLESSTGLQVPVFDVVSNPEFLREGTAIWDTFNPDRIVVGSDNSSAIEIMRNLYAPILNRTFAGAKTQQTVPFVVTDLPSAEMIKYAANAFLATKISFINEVANICERVGADVTQVAQGIGLDSRIGPKFLNAGLGWGGSCFPKDVSALVHTGQDYGYDARILKAAIEVNRDQRQRVIEKLQQELKVLKGKTIGLLGLTFKPDTDDMRDAPALTLIEQLSKLGARVKAYDPIISGSRMAQELIAVGIESNAVSLAQECDAIVVVTEWPEFLEIDFEQLASHMRRPLLVDGRNFLDPKVVRQAGFQYVGVGR